MFVACRRAHSTPPAIISLADPFRRAHSTPPSEHLCSLHRGMLTACRPASISFADRLGALRVRRPANICTRCILACSQHVAQRASRSLLRFGALTARRPANICARCIAACSQHAAQRASRSLRLGALTARRPASICARCIAACPQQAAQRASCSLTVSARSRNAALLAQPRGFKVRCAFEVDGQGMWDRKSQRVDVHATCTHRRSSSIALARGDRNRTEMAPNKFRSHLRFWEVVVVTCFSTVMRGTEICQRGPNIFRGRVRRTDEKKIGLLSLQFRSHHRSRCQGVWGR